MNQSCIAIEDVRTLLKKPSSHAAVAKLKSITTAASGFKSVGENNDQGFRYAPVRQCVCGQDMYGVAIKNPDAITTAQVLFICLKNGCYNTAIKPFLDNPFKKEDEGNETDVTAQKQNSMLA